MKSPTISALSWAERPWEEILLQRSLSPGGGVEEESAPETDSAERLKHQLLPLIGKTTSRALMIPANSHLPPPIMRNPEP